MRGIPTRFNFSPPQFYQLRPAEIVVDLFAGEIIGVGGRVQAEHRSEQP